MSNKKYFSLSLPLFSSLPFFFSKIVNELSKYENQEVLTNNPLNYADVLVMLLAYIKKKFLLFWSSIFPFLPSLILKFLPNTKFLQRVPYNLYSFLHLTDSILCLGDIQLSERLVFANRCQRPKCIGDSEMEHGTFWKSILKNQLVIY